tara:strand:- start:23 stop:514 length:492 start_codon:yes stop_codon:yes gene_type:complete
MKHIIQQRIFSVEECNKIINCKSTFSNKADNSPVDIIDDIEENKWIVKRIKDALLKANKRNYRFKDVELYERIGIKRYQTGDGYKWHTDGIDLRRLTNVLFLNNDYTGGDLRIFCGEEVVIKNNIGVLVTFPSWYFHQADEVLSGERKVLVSFLKGERFEFFE